MSVTFYGEWSLVVVSKNAAFEERVRIVGSAGSDGVVNGVAGQGIADINGPSWQAFMEWSSDGGATWYPSQIKRIPSVTSADGLIVTLFADDNFPGQGDGDYNDLIAQFVYLNRNVNPLGPGPSPYGFTVPKSSFWPPLKPGPRPDPCGCECICTCRKPKRRRRCSC